MIESVMVYDSDGTQTVEHYTAQDFLTWLDREREKRGDGIEVAFEDLERFREQHGYGRG